MDADLMKWLNMVWGALDEQDSDKRIHLLQDANTFLEQVRENPAEQLHDSGLASVPMSVSEAGLLQTS